MPARLPRAGTHPHDRNGFMIGFGIGAGSAGIEDSDERETKGMGNLRIGYAVRPTLVLQLETTAWRKTEEAVLLEFDGTNSVAFRDDATVTFATSAFALTYYPPSSGLFLRGGVGIANANAEFETGDIDVSTDETGLGILGALGYEWRRIARRGAAHSSSDHTSVLSSLLR